MSSDQAIQFLAQSGLDPIYGARPLKRAIQQKIINLLAQQILSGVLKPEKSIKIDTKSNQIIATQ